MQALRAWHERRGARFTGAAEVEAVADYGDWRAEYAALKERVGLLDFSFRGRVCVTGQDRIRFLHGQVTNDISGLPINGGCYAALTNAKARMLSDLNIYRLADELLLDFEPGLTRVVTERLEKYIIADDAQIVDVSSAYGLLRLQGPRALETVNRAKIADTLPAQPFQIAKLSGEGLGESYVANRSRKDWSAFDFFVPADALERLVECLLKAIESEGGRLCGWTAFDVVRLEAGLPRFGVDMDETIIPLEAGLEIEGISFKKGCYIGQEIISRIRTYSEVAKALRRLELSGDLKVLPGRKDPLLLGGKEAGFVTSAVASPALHRNIALGYVRKESNQVGTELVLRTGGQETVARIVGLPFEPF